MTNIDPEGARTEKRVATSLVVGLGASAGGVEALRTFFSHVPARSGSAYVVILHLSPDYDSKLAEVLQTTAVIPVTQVTHPVRIEPDHVYVIPPSRRLEIVDSTLTLSDMTQREHRRSPVDVFFRALADAHGSRSVAVVLSGTGPNGSAGLKRVKEYGGLTIAQEPDEAGYADMPNNAIATGEVDLVLRVADMPARIVDYHQRLQHTDALPAADIDPQDDPDALREVLSLLRVRTGHDFANYKSGTLMRRLQRRMHVVEVSTLSAYARLMREQPQEAVMLMKGLLITSQPTRPLRAEAPPVERFAPLDAHHRLLEEYAPPSLIVTEDNTIVHMSPRAAGYLQMSAGEPSHDLLKLIRPELRVELRTALFQATKERTSVKARNISIVTDGVERRVDVIVRPVLRDDDPARGFFLILFADHDGADGPERNIRALDTTPESIARQLEEELARIKGQLRTTIEQYEAQVEEAQASAEEHQAMNEELATVNQELKIKLEELRLSNNDFQNLINSTDIATIFLDRSLRLKLTTPRAQDIFNVLRTDIGRPLSDITTRLTYTTLDADLRTVLNQLQPIDREVMTTDHRWFLMRIRPYRTTDDRIDGVVLMFQDISARRHAEREVSLREERLRLLINSVTDYAIFTMTPEGRVHSWSTGAQRMFGYSAEDIVGLPFDVLFTKEDREAGVPLVELERARRDGRAVDERYHMRSDGTRFFVSGVTARLGDEPDLEFAKVARDLTSQQHAAEAMRQAHPELDVRGSDRGTSLETAVAEQQAAQVHAVNLLRKLVNAQEDERGRIARNLHDQLGQRLTALRLALERSQERLSRNGGCDEELERAIGLTQSLDADVGFLSWELRPAVLDHLGLGLALPRYTKEWSDHYDVEIAYKGDSFRTGLLTHEGEVAFYRIAQEALTNVAKHAHASRVDVMLESRDHSAMLVIEDDGVGFDATDRAFRERGIGLLSMRERAALIGADFQLESKPGDGTSIYVRYSQKRPRTEP